MATQSTIGYYDGKTVKFIYCHWDGYPSHNGKILLEHYTDIEKIKALIDLGAISSLGARLAPNSVEVHTFNDRVKDVVVAYARDKKEEISIMTKNSSNLQQALKHAKSEYYAYVFDIATNMWYYKDYNGPRKLTLEDVK